MARKKLFHQLSHLSSDEKEIDKTKDIEFKEILNTSKDHESQSEKIIKNLYLEPAGYPIKPFDAPDNLQVVVNDPNLFQAYASEMWLGLSVSVNDYVFDSLIIADYAFKITKIVPKGSNRIGADTKFNLIEPIITRPKIAQVHFSEIVGNLQAIEKAQIIVEYLKNPIKFGKWGPKNILFYGPPGTGKTLTARAIATEANCPFLARKGTMLIGLHVGDGAAKIHQLFQEAKSNAPTIIFIDELDSIGLNRSFQSVRGDVIEVATALLSELDGLEENKGVITIGATNSIDLLDPGLRSRFEEEIEFPMPNELERIQLLTLFSKDSPVSINADFKLLAKRTDKWSGRDLHEKLMKIAIHRAIREKIPEITTKLLLQIITQVLKSNNQSPPSGLFA